VRRASRRVAARRDAALDDGARARDLGVDDDDARTSRARDAETAVDDDDAARGGGSANER
jgi:hypothetical protein